MTTKTGHNVSVMTAGSGAKLDVLGVLLEWKAAPGDGPFCLLEATVPPGVGVPMHQHPEQEIFYVLEGEAAFAREHEGNLEWIAVHSGGAVHIPGEVMHGFRNAGSSTARLLIAADGKLGAFFAEAGTPADAPVAGPPSADDIARVMAIATKYGQRFAPPSA